MRQINLYHGDASKVIWDKLYNLLLLIYTYSDCSVFGNGNLFTDTLRCYIVGSNQPYYALVAHLLSHQHYYKINKSPLRSTNYILHTLEVYIVSLTSLVDCYLQVTCFNVIIHNILINYCVVLNVLCCNTFPIMHRFHTSFREDLIGIHFV